MTSPTHPEYDPKGMPFRRLGATGLRVPLFSLGGWLTLGGQHQGQTVKDIIRTAFEHGINMFDTAEEYAQGRSESEMGRAIKELNFRRSDIVVTTKLFWGTRPGPNNSGLSRKHIIEGTRESLERLQMEYVDVIFAHRCDVTVPMEEIVRAFNFVINQGYAYYWATSEWTAQQIEEAFHVADKLGLMPPVAEQCKHNMLHRERPEAEYAPLYKKYGYGTTTFSSLAGGLLTGKYNDGIPPDSRYSRPEWERRAKELGLADGSSAELQKIKSLAGIASELNTTLPALALAWVAKNSNTSTVILGASKPEQVVDNLKAIAVLPKLTAEVLEKLEGVLGNRPEAASTYGRPALDVHGRL